MHLPRPIERRRHCRRTAKVGAGNGIRIERRDQRGEVSVTRRGEECVDDPALPGNVDI